MKKVKIIVAAVLRGIILIAPGTTFAWWAWGKVPALFSILATVGLETLYLFIYSFVVVSLKAAKDRKDKQTEESTTVL